MPAHIGTDNMERSLHFAIYDNLPPVVRKALRNAPYNLSVKGMDQRTADVCLDAIHQTVVAVRQYWINKGWP